MALNSIFFFNNNFFTKYLSTTLLITKDISIYDFYSGYFFNIYRI
uniref:Nad5_iii n=1 Tax=Oxytricha trifallax TaxID=1172189 RepID=G9HRC8_9SPIT|nr:nad5_iii [Oxytricha trifallax]